jgi:hypothetical protein
MKPSIVTALFLLLSTPALAAGPQKICFDEGGVADYRADGSYNFGSYNGTWEGERQHLYNYIR